MDCRGARRRLSAWLDDELAAPVAAGLERHLDACPDCRRQSAELTAARDRFRALAPERSRLRAADVLARAARAPGAAPALGSARRRLARTWLPLAAALALTAAGLWWAGSRERPASGSPRPSATAPAAAVSPHLDLPGLDCPPAGGEGCRRLACLDPAECGAGTEEPWPPISL